MTLILNLFTWLMKTKKRKEKKQETRADVMPETFVDHVNNFSKKMSETKDTNTNKRMKMHKI